MLKFQVPLIDSACVNNKKVFDIDAVIISLQFNIGIIFQRPGPASQDIAAGKSAEGFERRSKGGRKRDKPAAKYSFSFWNPIFSVRL